jgi:hypothetical protein
VYPNPSSGLATLSYQLNSDNMKVSIEVFNMIGQRIVSLVNETMNHGKYTLPVSNHGRRLEPGSYMIRMTVNGFSETQILQIIR